MKKKNQKIIQFLMLICMFISSIETPIKVFANELENVNPQKGDLRLGSNGTISLTKSVSTKSASSDGLVEVIKTVTAKDTENGKYNVTFEIQGKQSEDKSTPVYVVVVFDTSGSMCSSVYNNCTNMTKWNNAINGAKSFSKTLINKLKNSYISLVTFDRTATKNRSFKHEDLSSANFGTPGGGTNIHDGLIKAREYLNNDIKESDKQTAQKYIVIMSDGEPTNYINSSSEIAGDGNSTSKKIIEQTLTEAQKIKNNNVQIFSIGYSLNNNIVYSGNYIVNEQEYKNQNLTSTDILKLLSTSDSQESNIKHYVAASNENNIANAFENIATSIIIPGTNVTLKDNIGSSFKITTENNYGTTYSSPVIDKITNDIIKYSFDIEINKDSPTGWHKTNQGFTLTYTDSSGKNQIITNNNDPEVYWIQNTYNYKVNYYKDSITTTNLIASDIRKAPKGTIVGIKNESIVTDVIKDKYLETAGQGYEYNSISPDNVIIDESLKEINILYTLKKYSYNVNYFYDDGINIIKDNNLSTTINNVPYGTNIDPKKYYLASSNIKEGYKLDSSNRTTNLLVTINSNSKSIDIYYIRDSFNYQVNYLFNGITNNNLSKNKNLALYNDVIKAEDFYLPSEVLKNNNYEDYFLNPINPSNPKKLTIGINPKNNKIDIYYINTQVSNENIKKNATIKDSNGHVKNTITSSNDIISYSINYTVNISNLKAGEEVTVIITDKLPFNINTSLSNLNNGFYDEENKTITWTINTSNDMFKTNYQVNKTINFDIVYKDFANISSNSNNNLENIAQGQTVIKNKKTIGVNTTNNIPVEIFGKLIVKHVDINDPNKLLIIPYEETTKKVGTIYNTNPENIYGYTHSSVSGNPTGTYIDGITTVIYQYQKNDGLISNEKVTKNGPKNLDNINANINYELNYTATINDYLGLVKLSLEDSPEYLIDINNSIIDNKCIYNELNNKITCTKEYNITKDESTHKINAKFNLSLKPAKINQEIIKNNIKSILTYRNNQSIDEDYAKTTIEKGQVIATYKDTNGNTLSNDILQTGLAGSNYLTEKKEFYGYSLKKITGDSSTGIYLANSTLTTNYVYEKNIGSHQEKLIKYGDKISQNINDPFNYEILYNAEILDYVGDVKIIIKDYLPYEIDDSKSNIGSNCKYQNKILECNYLKKITNESEKNINIKENIRLYYKNITSYIITNRVESFLTYDKTNTNNHSDFTTEILTGSLVIKYLDENGKSLSMSDTIIKPLGTEYTTNKKVFDNYYLKEIIGNENGIYKESPTEVTYVYSTIPLPPQTGVNTNKNYLNIILYLIIFSLIKRIYL